MTRPTTTALLLGALLAAALSGCTGGEPPLPAPTTSPSRPGPASAAPSATPSPTPSLTPSPTPSGTVAPAPGRTTASPSRPPFPPAARDLTQGSVVWGVYLAVSRLGDDGRAQDRAELDRARARAEAVGYEGQVGGGDADCDRGAREALGLDPDREYVTAALYFDTEAQARQFVAAYEPGVVGLARVTAFCLD